MKVLVIGSGGREHALAWKIKQSPLVSELYCAPGNPGMAALGACVDIPAGDIDGLLGFAKENKIDLTVVGPEDPLANGIIDRFAEEGLTAFGPNGRAAQLEASKAFAKSVMQRYRIPTAEYAEFSSADEATAYVEAKGVPLVIKADGLAAGKGVTVAHDVDNAIDAVREAMVEGVFGAAGSRVVIEEFLVGEEASILAFTDGKTVIPMVASQDHKAAYDGDQGPNTGGMGAYSPAPVITNGLAVQIQRTVLQPCVDGLANEGIHYTGVLYAGLMITKDGPKVIEFNCRFGDPETQVVLPRMKSDLVPVLLACCNGTLHQQKIAWDDRACVSVVMASGGYPKAYDKGKVISGIERAERDAGVMVFHAGTKHHEDNVVTNGGRVLNVTALGTDIRGAITMAYAGVRQISFEGAHFRTDIGHRALARHS
ncbi:MAG: phosphoribosylamine--glycine ligase [Candidatus Hydrogenedentes bacterium]|nr:phosphoribosylamine--glycine ligase [Candidatus Hydrogenedentota bacterium]